MRSIGSPRRLASTIGINGIGIATIPFTTRTPIAEPIATIRARAISMLMALGPKFPIMARCGFLESITAGPPIGLAVGFGSPTGVGLGSLMNLGDGRHITMADGSSGAEHGLGGLARSSHHFVRFGRRHMSPSSDLEEA